MINVWLADDHPMVISGVQQMLKPVKHIRISNCFLSAEALLTALRSGQPDVLLLDVRMPEMEGPELAAKIREDFPEVKILVITSLNAPSVVKAMMSSGCKGFLLKNTDQKILVEAIEAVFRNEEYIEAQVKEQLVRNMLKFKSAEQHPATTPPPALTRREKEILELIIKEYSNQEIAETLYISLRTVENHRFNLQQKLQVKNTVALVKLAIQMGIV